MPNHDLAQWQDAADERQEARLTACKDCAYFRSIGTMSTEQVCADTPFFRFSAITGKRRQDGFVPVHDINKGNCVKFKEKEKKEEESK